MQPEVHMPAVPLGIGDRVKTIGPRWRKCDRGLAGLVVKVSNGSVLVHFDDGSAGEFEHDHDGLILVLRGRPFCVGDRVRTKGPGWRKCSRGELGVVVKVNNSSVHVIFDGCTTADEEYDLAHDCFTLVRSTDKRRDAARAAAFVTRVAAENRKAQNAATPDPNDGTKSPTSSSR